MYTTESIVKQYEDILDYLAHNDDYYGFEVVSRLHIDEEWDMLSETYKQRILAVDNVVLKNYADAYTYALWNEYISVIKTRLALTTNQ